MNIQATSVQYLQYTLITANPSHVYIRSDHTRAGLEISSCTAGLLLVSCLDKIVKKKTLTHFDSNEQMRRDRHIKDSTRTLDWLKRVCGNAAGVA